jgi:hypothetical protein
MDDSSVFAALRRTSSRHSLIRSANGPSIFTALSVANVRFSFGAMAGARGSKKLIPESCPPNDSKYSSGRDPSEPSGRRYGTLRKALVCNCPSLTWSHIRVRKIRSNSLRKMAPSASTVSATGIACSTTSINFGTSPNYRTPVRRWRLKPSELQVLLPHRHSNMRNMRPEDGSRMLVMNLGCSPHVKQRGEVGCRAAFLMLAQNAEKSLRTS